MQDTSVLLFKVYICLASKKAPIMVSVPAAVKLFCCWLQLLACCKLLTMFGMIRGEWEKIGTVVGGPGEDTVAAGNQFHEGQQYDFVFDVDVADGMPPLKLPVNKGDNPYVAADK